MTVQSLSDCSERFLGFGGLVEFQHVEAGLRMLGAYGQHDEVTFITSNLAELVLLQLVG